MVELRVLFGLSDLNEPVMNPRSEEDFSICRADASPGQNYIVKFTPPSESRIDSRGRYSSSGGISKSVPRRKSDIKTKTNRSLNFDIGKRTYHQSTNNSINKTNLSRSAKMLKSLNIDINNINNNSAKKINKTLNFDTTPSPKRLSTNGNNKSKRNMSNLTLDSPGIIKTLQYDSSSETSDASPMNLSNGSIDENQNKTPSSNNNNRKAKKSLSYSSPSSNGKSPDFSVLSPGLRTELREKIDDIVHTNNSTPKFINFKNKITENAAVSTPRNLFNNYSDDDDDDGKKMKGKNSSDEIVKDKKEVEFIEKEGEEDEESPETPKNTICVVPESMSAIKKSHRKERVTGRLLKLEKSNIDKSFKMNTDNDEKEEEENISLTPETKNIKNTFNHTIDSIKKSHKKDRQNKNKSCSIDSDDDDLSETGSLFDYSTEKLNDNDVNDNKIDKIPRIIIQEHQTTNEELINKIDTNKTTTTTTTTSTGNSTTTPENKIDYLRRIMTDSIKKSHKKVKDLNKKSLFKPRTLEKGLDDENDNKIITIDNNNITDDDKNRSGTPENMNSSRLLLDKFNSVKKSHKKDKHRVAGFSQQRQINLSNTKADDTQQIDEASTSKTADNKNWQLNNLGTSLLDDNNEPKPLCTSPNKRKNPSSDDDLQISSSSGCWKIENELNNDEFKIFTPIKKKKPLKVISTATSSSSTIDDSKLLADENIEIGRCETPKLSQEIDDDNNNNNNFKTPIKSKKINTDDANDDEEINDDEQIDDVNGRLTPENQALHPHITGLSSIKKSHKKDKWTKSTKRTSYLLKKFIDVKNIVDSPMKENKTKTWRTNIDNQSSSDSAEKCDDENQSSNSNSPKASTSCPIILNNTNSPTKTPPNTLETKTYLRLLQTTSIKRSHKKMRDKKKQESIIFDPDLSDDGSIFDESDKKINDSSVNDLDNNDCLPLEGDDDHANVNDLTEKITCSKRRCSSGNKSDDGSIFGSDSEQQITPRRRNFKMIKNDTT